MGIKDVQHKACLFEYLKTNANTKNPYDSIDDYLHWGENIDEEDGYGKGWGRRGRRGRRGYGRRGGRGGRGGGSGSGSTMPQTASGAIKGKVTDPFSGSASNAKPYSNLDDVYRKKARKLMEQSRTMPKVNRKKLS